MTHLPTYIFFFLCVMNQDIGMDLTPFPYNIKRRFKPTTFRSSISRPDIYPNNNNLCMKVNSANQPGINILRVHFLYESKWSSFSLIMFGFAIFWRQNICEKVALKMLMKLTPTGKTVWQKYLYKSRRNSKKRIT